MDVNIIRTAMHARPFQPFRLRLADMRSIFIPHPDFIAVSPRRVAVIDPLDETFLLIEPLLIVSLDCAAAPAVTPPEAGDSTNGPAGEGSGSPA